MHKSTVLFGVIVTFLSGCGGDALRERSQIGRLGKVELDRLQDLNDMQQDNIDAREYGKSNGAVLAISEKSKVMGEKLSAECVRSGSIPDNDLNGTIHEETISGVNCPLYWFRRRNYNISTKIMAVAENLVVVSDDYRKKYSALNTRNFSGTYSVVPDRGGFRVSGVIKFNEFSTVAYGRLQGSITVDHRNKANEGAGHVTLSLSSPRGWRHMAAINWTLRRGAVIDIIYSIDNYKVEQDEFFGLFSAYELDKIMDNALRMK